ncbi:MAG: pantoate--beta-alanine ligase [Actinomycetota bacterium]
MISTGSELRTALGHARRLGRDVEFVPTMGAFHEGHLELMRRARRHEGLLVVSIFVNPTQFGPGEDFDSYPRTLKSDIAAARNEGVDLVFAPDTAEMYPGGRLETSVDVGAIGRILEGRFRPEHFAGVATVCAKLFNLVEPDRVYLGQKDAQQLAVLSQMAADLNFGLQIVACPTVREADGLAMSSRNGRLSPDERRQAVALSDALHHMVQQARQGEIDTARLREQGRKLIARQAAVDLQYLEIVDRGTFESLDRLTDDALAVVAAIVGPVRLIDNAFVGTA